MRAGARALRPKPGQTDLDLVFFLSATLDFLLLYFYRFLYATSCSI
jgi:hypothetical protein